MQLMRNFKSKFKMGRSFRTFGAIIEKITLLSVYAYREKIAKSLSGKKAIRFDYIDLNYKFFLSSKLAVTVITTSIRQKSSMSMET